MLINTFAHPIFGYITPCILFKYYLKISMVINHFIFLSYSQWRSNACEIHCIYKKLSQFVVLRIDNFLRYFSFHLEFHHIDPTMPSLVPSGHYPKTTGGLPRIWGVRDHGEQFLNVFFIFLIEPKHIFLNVCFWKVENEVLAHLMGLF
jgi:hypothetical protein